MEFQSTEATCNLVDLLHEAFKAGQTHAEASGHNPDFDSWIEQNKTQLLGFVPFHEYVKLYGNYSMHDGVINQIKKLISDYENSIK